MIKVGDGPHYVSESKEVQREDETNELKHKPYRPTRSKELPRHILAEADANKRRNKKTINHTDSWLERHFGSNSSLSASSTELSRPGSREGYGIRRSASICDIRPVGSSANAFYATVSLIYSFQQKMSYFVNRSGSQGKLPMSAEETRNLKVRTMQ